MTIKEIDSMKKTYILICGFADVVAGGPIYYSNKVKYLKERGWEVIVIPTNTGKRVFVRGMERYLGPYVPFILDLPSEYNKKQLNRQIDFLETFVPVHRGQTIIETGTDYTNFWGEALAQRLKAKHIVIFLDEQNERVNSKVIDFYKFKYKRGELACITAPAMRHLFRGYWDLPLEKCYSLRCSCTNSIEDYDHPFTHQIIRSDYNIGYIGRLEKPFLPTIIEGFVEFSKKNTHKTITIVFWGGAFEEKTVCSIREKFDHLYNVNLLISGYMFPLPVKALQKMDVFVSGAGSALVGAKVGRLSVKVDFLNYKVLGIMQDFRLKKYAKCPIGDSVCGYLDWILNGKCDIKPLSPDYKNDCAIVCENFNEHMQFIENSSPVSSYYDVSQLGLTMTQYRKKIIRSIVGVKAYNAIHGSSLYQWIWRCLHKKK